VGGGGGADRWQRRMLLATLGIGVEL